MDLSDWTPEGSVNISNNCGSRQKPQGVDKDQLLVFSPTTTTVLLNLLYQGDLSSRILEMPPQRTTGAQWDYSIGFTVLLVRIEQATLPFSLPPL
jgi:hypothetical protein